MCNRSLNIQPTCSADEMDTLQTIEAGHDKVQNTKPCTHTMEHVVTIQLDSDDDNFQHIESQIDN